MEADLLDKMFGHFNCHVVHNGVEPDLFRNASARNSFRNGEFLMKNSACASEGSTHAKTSWASFEH